jgi:DNA-directed RNA polymerase specialized sigma subunit
VSKKEISNKVKIEKKEYIRLLLLEHFYATEIYFQEINKAKNLNELNIIENDYALSVNEILNKLNNLKEI